MTMRPIDADAFEEELEDFSFGGISLIYDNPHDKMVARHTVSEVIFLLDRAHTIESKPVTHAYWISKIIRESTWSDDDYAEEIYNCSNCNMTIEYNTPYCPYCGAQMNELISNTNELNSSEKSNNSKDVICRATNLPCSKCMPCCGSKKEK